MKRFTLVIAVIAVMAIFVGSVTRITLSQRPILKTK